MRRRYLLAGCALWLAAATACSGSSSSQDTTSPSYDGGYQAGDQCARTYCDTGGAEAVCGRLATFFTLSADPPADPQAAQRGCRDGYTEAGGR